MSYSNNSQQMMRKWSTEPLTDLASRYRAQLAEALRWAEAFERQDCPACGKPFKDHEGFHDEYICKGLTP